MSTPCAPVLAGADILIVGDTAANRKLLSDILLAAGYRPRPAENGNSALRSAQAKPPALVLLDPGTPGTDGFEVCRRLKESEPTRQVPVVFLIAAADAAGRASAFARGAVDYIVRPFHRQEVLARIGSHLGLVAARGQLASQDLRLQQVSDQLEEIHRSVGNGIISVDESQRIVRFNRAAERMFGCVAAEAIGQPLNNLLPQRFRARHTMQIRQFGQSGPSVRTMGAYGPIYALRAGGEEFPIEATISQSGSSPGKLFTVILRDITERRHLEQERERQVRQLELLSERLATAQEEEHSRIAYELNEELAQELLALKIYLELLDPGAGAPAQSSRADAIAVAAHATRRIRNLVLHLDPRELRDFGLHAAIRAYCERQAAAAGWKLHIDAPMPDTRAPLAVEKAGFHVLREALSNVLLRARASEVWVHCHQCAGQLELRIRDDGIGFDRGIDREETRREHGGLGLFGMQVRAKQVGGRVEIKSTVGAGTEVRAVFPLAAAG